jgi:hypothetical protein
MNLMQLAVCKVQIVLQALGEGNIHGDNHVFAGEFRYCLLLQSMQTVEDEATK